MNENEMKHDDPNQQTPTEASEETQSNLTPEEKARGDMARAYEELKAERDRLMEELVEKHPEKMSMEEFARRFREDPESIGLTGRPKQPPREYYDEVEDPAALSMEEFAERFRKAPGTLGIRRRY